MKLRIWSLIIAVYLGFGMTLFAQETTDPAVLFRQLQVRKTTDNARRPSSPEEHSTPRPEPPPRSMLLMLIQPPISTVPVK
jgi:hypothetical protein